MVAKLLPLFPAHRTYVEPFGGGASLLVAKTPSPVEVYNDLDEGLVGFFRMLRDPEKFAKFHLLASLTPYARREWEDCRDTWESCEDEVERAYRWFVIARQGFSGLFASSWSSAITLSRRGMAKTAGTWLSCIEMLPQIAARLLRVQIECQDWRVILNRYDTVETLFYCDPPYVLATRRDGGYKHEMTQADHQNLVKVLLSIQGMCILSGYAHGVYNPLEDAGWERHDWKTACYAAGRTRNSNLQGNGSALLHQPRTESAWVKPYEKGQRRMW